MPDMKFADSNAAEKYLEVKNYPEVNQEAVKEMHRQVGDLQLNKAGIANCGLLVRHLVLPAKLGLQFLNPQIQRH